jgi:GAF domain-containing protein
MPDSLEKQYQRIFDQLKGLLNKTDNTTAKMASVAALLFHKMPQFFWVGFYILHEEELTVGPYQGPLACLVLEKKKGVCWSSLLKKKTIIVPNVHKYPEHIPCDSRSNSEIVVPFYSLDKKIWAVLDVDSTKFDAFSETDRIWLEKIASLI